MCDWRFEEELQCEHSGKHWEAVVLYSYSPVRGGGEEENEDTCISIKSRK